MSLPPVFRTGFILLACQVMALSTGQTAHAESSFDAFVGEITAETLNVRSGPSLNYYVVARLSAGDHVRVIDTESGWYAIVPPAECHSLISMDFVESAADGGRGVVTGDNVRVRAGSDIEHKKYAVQLKLDKGATVSILGDDGEGFYKITPPEGARVWVHSEYVARVADAPVAQPEQPVDTPPVEAKPQQKGPAETGETIVDNLDEPRTERTPDLEAADDSPTETRQANPVEAPAETAKPSAPVMTAQPKAVESKPEPVMHDNAGATDSPVMQSDLSSPSKVRTHLKRVEEQLKAEMDLPASQRRFSDVVDEYKALAAQETDRYVSAYAKRRLEQIALADASAQAVDKVHDLANELTSVRQDALQSRTSIRPFSLPIDRGFDAKGELRESMIYASPIGPQRYRLIDPDMEVPRTLCYVEIPADSQIDVSDYLGRIVGIRARDKYLMTGDVDPIVVVVAEEIVALGTWDGSDDPAETTESNQPAPADNSTASVEVISLVDTPGDTQ